MITARRRRTGGERTGGEPGEGGLELATGLVALRERAGLSQRELAGRMGVSQPRVAAIERSHNVTVEVLGQYARAVGGSLDVSVVQGGRRVELVGQRTDVERGREPPSQERPGPGWGPLPGWRGAPPPVGDGAGSVPPGVERSPARSGPGASSTEQTSRRAEQSSRRAEQAARSRDQILDAALAVIDEVGLEQASASLVARRAGRTWGAIQHHFGSRDELLLALVERNFWGLEADLRSAAVAGGSVLDRLQATADLMWAYCRDPRYRASWEIILSLRRQPEGARHYGERLARMASAWASAWDDLFAEVAGGDRGREVGSVLFGAMRGFALDRHTNPQRREFTREREHLVRLLAEDLGRAAPACGADGAALDATSH